MRALVTGGAGFIGSTLVDRLLAEGHSVDVVDDLSSGSLANLASARSAQVHGLSFHHLDIASPELVALMARRRPEVVFHLAGSASGTGLPAIEDARLNLLGSIGVIEASQQCGATKVVFASSGSDLYGPVGRSELPAKESQPTRPASAHGVGKAAVVEYLSFYRQRYDLEFAALALGEVYGPRQQPGADAVVAYFASRLLAGQACTVVGDGTDAHDLIYVDDVVDAFARAARRGGGLVLNVASGRSTTVNQVYAVVAEAIGSDLALNFDPSSAPVPKTASLDPSRARIHLGWKPWTSLSEGVAAVVEYFSAGRGSAT